MTWLVSGGTEEGSSGYHELYEWSSGYVTWWLAERFWSWDGRDGGVDMEGCWMWVGGR